MKKVFLGKTAQSNNVQMIAIIMVFVRMEVVFVILIIWDLTALRKDVQMTAMVMGFVSMDAVNAKKASLVNTAIRKLVQMNAHFKVDAQITEYANANLEEKAMIAVFNTVQINVMETEIAQLMDNVFVKMAGKVLIA